MRLTIIPEGPLAFDGKNYLYSEGEGIYIDNIAKHFEEVTICAYAFHKSDADYKATSYYHFKSKNLKFVELPLVRGVQVKFLSKVFQMLKVSKTIKKNLKDWDLLYLFLPGYPSALTYLLNKIYNKHFILYLASHWAEESLVLFPWSGIVKRIFYPMTLIFHKWVEKSMVKDAKFVLTAGGATRNMYEQLGTPIYETIPRINWEEIKVFRREDTCLSRNIRLLFVGYLILRKGPEYALRALTILKKNKIYKFTLIFIGAGDQEGTLIDMINDLNLKSNVEFMGHIPNGPQLMNIYQTSDIFILPTPYGEGFPRVLYEAMSQSIPIITTNVSGIPYKMIHEKNALLVEPRNPDAIAEAVERLISDGQLRRKMINEGTSFMEKVLENSDGGKQFYELLQRHLFKNEHQIRAAN
jgi:glycosyltransferase involved in cell wall biosynthesis